MSKTGTVVIDPGHGGAIDVAGSSSNNAVSPSGVLEKNITLRIAFLTREALEREAADGNHKITVVLTRDDDRNLSLKERAHLAKQHTANLFLSIHCNASKQHTARGVETLIRPTSAGNTNHSADKAFAQSIQNAVFAAIRTHDAKTKDRGVKDQELGVLRDDYLGGARACLVELEFIDRKDVDALLNIGPNALRVREDIASAIATALIRSL